MSENSAEVKSDSIVEPETQPEQPEEKPAAKSKRSAGKRLSMLTRTAQEGEAILKGMGHKEEAPEGRRTTRSSTRGSVVSQATPPPAKRERKTPSTGKGSSRRGRPKRDEPEEENEVDAENKNESKDEEVKEQKEENGKVEEAEQKENNVDDTDGGGKKMEVDESDTSAPVDDKINDNGPAEQPSSPVQNESETSKPGEPESVDNETKNEECSKKETIENSEADTREAPPPQSE